MSTAAAGAHRGSPAGAAYPSRPWTTSPPQRGSSRWRPAALALIALIAVVVLARALRRLRADQRASWAAARRRTSSPTPPSSTAASRSLNDYVGDVAAGLDARLTAAEERLDGAVAFHGLVRYDAYNEMSGRQSTSIALLDSSGSGIVISSIHHRDQARLYAKQVVDGRAELELSPEEEEAMRVALAGEVPDAGERRRRRSSDAPGLPGPARHVQRGGGARGRRRAAAPSSCPSRRSTRR